MKKLLKLRSKIEELREEVCPKFSTEPVQYWSGGDWQIQGLEKAYSNALKEIDKLIDSKGTAEKIPPPPPPPPSRKIKQTGLRL